LGGNGPAQRPPGYHTIHSPRTDPLKPNGEPFPPQNHVSRAPFLPQKGPWPSRNPNPDPGVPKWVLELKISNFRIEKPCRIQSSELQTEPYSASYGQKPLCRAPVKILMASWDTRASKWQSEAWRLVLYCKNQYKVARPTISPARDERDIDFDCIITVLGTPRVHSTNT